MEHHDMHHDCDGDGGHGHSHAMVFHAGVNQEILFNGWVTTNALELFGSAVAIFLAGVLYEGLKYYREALYVSSTTVTRDSQVNIAKNECGTNTNCRGPTVVKYTMLSGGHFIQTGFHIVQSTFSYILMLIFMTYNVWLCMALVLGMGLGYFFFGWRKSSVVDSNEHCQ
ncbi:high affinity copper uptake protein 1-like [Ostrinia nubilalis]|uniref:high affinity copper uptake protein 1-like n=1 Tax=Ostrinia nubilalis TaxID=29057 RepID=UPI0030826BE2